MLIRAYRIRGHFHAKLDPLEIEPSNDERRTRPALLWIQGSRPRSQDLPRQCPRARIRIDARDRRHPAPHLLPDAGRRVHAYLERRAEKRGFRSASRAATRKSPSPARASAPSSNKLVEAEGFEKYLRRQVHRRQALRPRRRRIADPGARADHQARRHLGVKEIILGMSHRGRLNVLTQVMGKPHRVLFHEFKGGSGHARRHRRLRRRQISSRRLVGPRVRQQQGASVADAESVASRNRRPGHARQSARQAGPARCDAGRPHHGDAAADPWRRGLRRSGRGGGMLRLIRSQRLQDRRFSALHRQQPDRLHDLSALLALVALSV